MNPDCSWHRRWLCRFAVPASLLLLSAIVVSSGCALAPRSPALAAARSAKASGDLRAAHRQYEAFLASNPATSAVLAELSSVRDGIATRARARATVEAGDGGAVGLRTALATLQDARAFDPGGERLGADRSHFQAELDVLDAENEQHAKLARAALAAGQWGRAQESLERLRGSDPESPLLGPLEAEHREKVGGALTADFNARLAAGEIARAGAVLERLEALLGPEEARPHREAFAKRELVYLTETIKRDRVANRFYTALSRARTSGRIQELGSVVAELRSDGSRYYVAQARLRMDRGETARAYLETLKAQELRSDTPGLFEVHRDARDAELAQLQSYLAVPTFGSPASHPDAGAQVSDRLTNHLFDVLPFGIKLIERDEIDVLISEQRRSFAELSDLLNLDLVVGGNVSLLRVEQQDRKQEAVTRVQVGTRRERNPEYDLREPGGPAIPKTIEVPVHESVRYKFGSTTTKGFATVSLRVFDSNRSAIIDADEFTARFEATDTYKDSVPGAGFEGDPLELPTETEVLVALREDLVQRITARILEHLGQRERIYLDRAKSRLERREQGLAMIPLASGLLYCSGAKLTADNPDCASLRQLLLQHSEQAFLSSAGSG